MNMQDLVVFRDTGSRTCDKYLMSYEGHVIAVRAHPAVLLGPAAEVLAGLIVCGVVATLTGFVYVWLLWLVLLGRLMWKVIKWSVEFFLTTEHRVMSITGVLNRKIAMMPLTKVTDIALERSIPGRLLGYGEFVLESAGQDQALRNIRFIPYPEQLYLEVSSTVFGSHDPAGD